MRPGKTQNDAYCDVASLGRVKWRNQYCKYTSWEVKQTKKWIRYLNWLWHLKEILLPEILRRHCQKCIESETASCSSFSFKKTANWRISVCILMVQSPKTSQGGVSLSSKVQSPSTKTVQPIKYKLSTSSLLMGGGCSYACSPLECFKIQRSNNLTTHAIILKELMSLPTTPKVEWEAQISMCQYSTFTFKASSFYHVNALFWTCQSQEKWLKR